MHYHLRSPVRDFNLHIMFPCTKFQRDCTIRAASRLSYCWKHLKFVPFAMLNLTGSGSWQFQSHATHKSTMHHHLKF